MRDIFTALALVWCLYNTWSLHHNFKQDRMANTIDKLTGAAMLSHNKRINNLEKEMKESVKILQIYFDITRKLVDMIKDMEK